MTFDAAPPQPQEVANPLEHKARQIALAVAKRGGRALLVGGYVRDELLGAAPKDADIEVYGLEAPILRETLQKLGRVDCVGESFRVYKLVWHLKDAAGNSVRLELDVSLPRRDKKIGSGHKGFEVEGDPHASIEDAARRRDFTVNAILKDPLSGEILDPFGGKADLERHMLRAVDARHFGEDSLRVLRAMQFAGRFGLEIEPETVAICLDTPLDDLPRERIWGEWEKWLLKSPKPSVGLRAGMKIGVFARLFPYIETAMRRRGEDLMAALDRAAIETSGLPHEKQVALMLATVGSYVESDDSSNELPHEKQVTLMLATVGSFLGWRDTKTMLYVLGINKMRGEQSSYDVKTAVIKLVGVRKTPRDWFERRDSVEDKEFRFFAARVEPDLALRLSRARGDFEAAAWFEENLRRLDVLNGPPAPLLLGRHLLEMGLAPGPQIGKIVERVYFLQLSGDVTSLEEAKEAARTLF